MDSNSGTADDARLLADLYAHNASRQMPQKGSSDQTVACFRRLGAGVVGSAAVCAFRFRPPGTGSKRAGWRRSGAFFGAVCFEPASRARLRFKAVMRSMTGGVNDKIGRLDALVNNAGVNINDRHWDKLTPENAKLMIDGNLAAAAQCVTVALPLMRAQQDGLIIHTASMAGRFIGGFPGPLYTAAKHGVVAMSHSINMQECVNGIRSCVFLPGEVATPILDQRPNPVGPEERARMVQPQDCADLILYIALLPKRLTMNEVMLSPTWNRAYVAAIRQLSNL